MSAASAGEVAVAETLTMFDSPCALTLRSAADLFLRQPLAEQARGLRRHVTELDQLEVGVLLGLLILAAHHRKSGDLLAELIVVEDERSRRGVLLGLLLGEPVGRAGDQHDAEQDPRRAAPEDAQRLLEA